MSGRERIENMEHRDLSARCGQVCGVSVWCGKVWKGVGVSMCVNMCAYVWEREKTDGQ